MCVCKFHQKTDIRFWLNFVSYRFVMQEDHWPKSVVQENSISGSFLCHYKPIHFNRSRGCNSYYYVVEQLAANGVAKLATFLQIWWYLAKYWRYWRDSAGKLTFKMTKAKIYDWCQIKEYCKIWRKNYLSESEGIF